MKKGWASFILGALGERRVAFQGKCLIESNENDNKRYF